MALIGRKTVECAERTSSVQSVDRDTELQIEVKSTFKLACVRSSVLQQLTASVVQWSEFLATYLEVPGSIPGHYKKKSSESGTGPLSPVSATEELTECYV
jgi:hypothetical protein